MTPKIRETLETILSLPKEESKKGNISYAQTYAKTALDYDMEGESLQVQIRYILANLQHWQGELARRTKEVLRKY